MAFQPFRFDFYPTFQKSICFFENEGEFSPKTIGFGNKYLKQG
jgi:hypothetical protein